VGEQRRHLAQQIVPRPRGLSSRGLDADDDVTEEVGPHRAELPLAHREREDVRRPVLATVDAVERVDARIAREHDRELRLPEAERSEEDASPTAHLPPVEPFVRAVFDDESDRHRRGRLPERRQRGLPFLRAPDYARLRVMTGHDIPAGSPGASPHRSPSAARRALDVGAARACVVVPALDAAKTVRSVVEDLTRVLGCDASTIIVVDDGSADDTAAVARDAGAHVVRRFHNGGKGAALVRGLEEARALGYEVALTVDADGQHPAESAAALILASSDPRALVLGVRDLVRDGAPRANQFSNGISNFFLSLFARRNLEDTQCGLRRYPVSETLALGARARGYAFEAEVILRALAAGIPVVETGVLVVYPPEGERVTHFDSVKDPMRIVGAVVRTLYDLRRSR